ncbi:MAG: hypothetical protein ACI4ST_02870, partial [Candidatus Gallimonas sp.]
MKRSDLDKRFREGIKPVFIRFGNAIIFFLLFIVLIFLVLNNSKLDYAGIPAWYVNLPLSVLLLAENAVKTWALKSYPPKIVCYVIDVLCLMTLTVFSNGTLISTLYIIILSEFYLNQPALSANIAMGVCSIVLFLITFAVSGVFKHEQIGFVDLVTNAFNDLVLLAMHF